jgi:hypothetical protein
MGIFYVIEQKITQAATFLSLREKPPFCGKAGAITPPLTLGFALHVSRSQWDAAMHTNLPDASTRIDPTRPRPSLTAPRPPDLGPIGMFTKS